MKSEYQFIFDLDGTLYQFSGSAGNTFASSRFYGNIQSNIKRFFATQLGLTSPEAEAEYNRLHALYNGEISLAVEREYGINRYDFFSQTWNLDPQQYLQVDPELANALLVFAGRSALLSAAPRIWVQAVLAYMGIENIFGEQVFTGEPNIRKPDERVFQQVALSLETFPQMVFSIGDQEYSDIAPAQIIGMKTILIGKPKNTVPDFYAPDILTAIKLLKEKRLL